MFLRRPVVVIAGSLSIGWIVFGFAFVFFVLRYRVVVVYPVFFGVFIYFFFSFASFFFFAVLLMFPFVSVFVLVVCFVHCALFFFAFVYAL